MPKLSQDRFRVFVSHKHVDAGLATTVAAALESLAPEMIECWVSGEDLQAGVDWNRQIKSSIAESHLLVLLFTPAPERAWDWCLYEVGLFMRFGEDDVSAVVCLFEKGGKTPAPLSQVQGVPAEVDALIERFLRPLCIETWRVSDDWQRGALVPNVEPEKLREAATAIANGFSAATTDADVPEEDVNTYWPCHRLVLRFDAVSDHFPWDRIPPEAQVIQGPGDTTSYTMALFGVQEGTGQHTWAELVDAVGGDHRWLDELDLAFRKGLAGKLWDPPMTTFEAWAPGSGERRNYLPVLYEIDRREPDRRSAVAATLILVPVVKPAGIGSQSAAPTSR